MNPFKIVIPGRPIAKKNNPRAFCISGCRGWRRGQGAQPKKLVLPSEDYCTYEKMALKCLLQWGNIQFTGQVQVEAYYWMPDRRSRPDLLGLEQATADILEKAGIISNDRNIARWGDSCIMGVDKTNPRAEIEITELGGINE